MLFRSHREWNKAQPAGTTLEETFAREEIEFRQVQRASWMRSYIAVFKHPFFAVTGVDGHFDLRNLPPGEYTVEAWQRKIGDNETSRNRCAWRGKNMDFVFQIAGPLRKLPRA